MSTNRSATTTGASGSIAPALFLWVVVICGLAYGVVQTATKIPALFGG
jgi:hypothetical protein